MKQREDIRYYREGIGELLAQIEGEYESIRKAAIAVAEAIQNDRMVHVIGSGGHSNMGVEEVLWKCGGLANLNCILDAGTNMIHGALRSGIIERTPGYAISVLDAYGVGRGEEEVIIIVNAYGLNSMSIDIVTECKKRGLTTIAVTSSSFAKLVPFGDPARHPSGKNLFEEADIFINNHLPLGDTIVSIDGYDVKLGPVSTFCNCFAMECIVLETIKELIARGIEPPVFVTDNLPGGSERNKHLEEKYSRIIKHL